MHSNTFSVNDDWIVTADKVWTPSNVLEDICSETIIWVHSLIRVYWWKLFSFHSTFSCQIKFQLFLESTSLFLQNPMIEELIKCILIKAEKKFLHLSSMSTNPGRKDRPSLLLYSLVLIRVCTTLPHGDWTTE